MNNNPFDPKVFNKNKAHKQAELEAMVRKFFTGEDPQAVSPVGSGTLTDFLKAAATEQDDEVLGRLKNPATMKEILESGRCANALGLMIGNPNTKDSLRFLTSQVSDKWHRQEVYLSLSKALGKCPSARQREVYSLLFHSFSSLGLTGQKVLLGLMEDRHTTKAHLNTMLGLMEGIFPWPKKSELLPVVGLSWMVEHKERFKVEEEVWGRLVVGSLFHQLSQLDDGEGTGWVYKALESVPDDLRQGLLLEQWKAQKNICLDNLVAFLPKEDIAYLAVEILATKEPSLANMVKPWLERSIIHDEIQLSGVKRKM